MRVLLTAVVLLILAVLAVVAVLYSGIVDMAATREVPAWARMASDMAMRRSVGRHAEGIGAPPLNDPGMIEDGARLYARHCAVCHGAPGGERAAFALAMTPQPRELARTARSWTPAQSFRLIRDGLMASGMPAWGAVLVDAEIWTVVAFQQALPTMAAEDYRRMVEPPPPPAPAAPEAEPQLVIPPDEGEPPSAPAEPAVPSEQPEQPSEEPPPPAEPAPPPQE